MSSNKTILVVAYHYPPINSAGVHRLLAFSRHLVRAGWNTTVVSVLNPHFDHVDTDLLAAIPPSVCVRRTWSFEYSRFEKGVFELLLGRKEADVGATAAQLHRVVAGRNGTSSVLKRALGAVRDGVRTYLVVPDLKVGWVPSAIAESLSLARRRRFDVVLTSSPPHSLHLVGLSMKWATRAKWIADFRDPWTQNAAYPHASGLRRYLDERLEAAVLSNADAVIANTDTNRSKLLAKFPCLEGSRCVTITNGFTREEYGHAAQHMGHMGGNGRKLNLVYTGVLYPGMGDSFFAALSQLKAECRGIEDDLHVEIVGEIQPEHSAAVTRHGLASLVECKGFLPRGESLARQAAADVLLCMLPSSEEARGWVPSKLYSYLLAGKPILGILPQGEAAAIIRKTRTGLCVEPNDVQGIKQALVEMVRGSREGRLHVTPDHEAIGAYDWRTLGQRFVAICEELV